MMYPKDDPKWVQATSVEFVATGYVNVEAYGERFEKCRVEWSDPFLNKSKSDVLVQNSRGDWLRVWFFDADVRTL
jgi:hypothetical protein